MLRFKRNRFLKVFSKVLAAIVVFVTTYSLILPALTIEFNKAKEMPGLDVQEQQSEADTLFDEASGLEDVSGDVFDEAADLQNDPYEYSGDGEIEFEDSIEDYSVGFEETDAIASQDGEIYDEWADDSYVYSEPEYEAGAYEIETDDSAAVDETYEAAAADYTGEYEQGDGWDYAEKVVTDVTSLTAETDGAALTINFDEACPSDTEFHFAPVAPEFYNNYYDSIRLELKELYPEWNAGEARFYSVLLPFARIVSKLSFAFDPSIAVDPDIESRLVVADWSASEWHFYDEDKVSVFHDLEDDIDVVSFETEALANVGAEFSLIMLWKPAEEQENVSDEETAVEADSIENSSAEQTEEEEHAEETETEADTEEVDTEETVAEETAEEFVSEEDSITDITAQVGAEEESETVIEDSAEEFDLEEADEEEAIPEEEMILTDAEEALAEEETALEEEAEAADSEAAETEEDEENDPDAKVETITEMNGTGTKPSKNSGAPSYVGVAGTRIIEVPGEDYKIRVSYDADAGIPEDAEIVAVPVSDEDYASRALELVEDEAEEEGSTDLIGLFDLTVYVDGNVVLPTGQIDVTVEFPDEIPKNQQIYAVHFPGTGEQPVYENEEGGTNAAVEEVPAIDNNLEEDATALDEEVPAVGDSPEEVQEADPSFLIDDIPDELTEDESLGMDAVNEEDWLPEEYSDDSDLIIEEEGSEPEDIEAKAISPEEKAPEVVQAETIEDEAAFTVEGFSYIALVSYTVDFEYSVNGKMYRFSMPGGGFVSFTDLVEVLGIIGDTNSVKNGEENRPEFAESAEENGINGGTEESGIKGDTNPAFLLGDVEVSDATREFVADVVSIEFSSPELMDVSKAETDTTVGQIKESRGLECEYSADLTEDQISEINAQMVETGDWALVSLKPFTSEETLTVTMKDGDVFNVKVTDAQITTHVITAKGEHFRITVIYDEDAKIPDGSELVAREILEGTEEYEKYLYEAGEKWEETDREGYISFARFFDIEIQKDGAKVEPDATVEVEIVHDDGFAFFEDESLSVIHFAEDGTEIIDEIQKNGDSTQIVYEQDSFSVIGTVSTVKDSGWPTSNGQYVLVLQDGDDYYALNQDGTLKKVRFFNNTVSFIGEGTTTTGYINDYLWYVVSSGNRGKISDEYAEYNATPAGQTFIDLYSSEMFSGTSRQLQIRDGKIYCNGQLPGSSGYTQVTLSASGGQLSRVALTSDSASPVFFAAASSFTANENETDLFTQVEVESIIDKWRAQKIQEATYDKTAEVYDYENRIYQVDIAASSSNYEVAPSIALEFVVDASRSMFFPTSVDEVGTFSGTSASDVRNWINVNGNTDQVYFVIQDKNGKATQYAIFYDPNSEYQVEHQWWTETKRGQWLWCDASVYNPPDDVSNGGTHNSMQAGLPLSSWTYGNMDDGKIYTTGITGSSDGTYGTRKTWISRIEYLKQCVRVASQVIYAVDEDAQIGLIGFNWQTTDYGTFGKNEQETLLSNIDNISLDGGTNHQQGLQKAIDKYQDSSFYAEHYARRKHVVVLVTDGAPNASDVNWTTIGNVATTLKNLEDDFGNKTELYTMGLSLTNVGSNQSNLFGVSSGTGYTYAGEDAAQIINAVTKMVDGIFVQANLVADVTDVIDPVFYPVNKADGRPLEENDWINLNGTKVNAGSNDSAGQIKKDATTGNWYVEWKDQRIDWPTTDSNGGITEPGWHGTVFVKAKEDFLGGNGINTNAAGSQLEATKFIVRGETELHILPDGDHTTSFETPYVNVDELDITKNDTEWTVYLGTNVDPLTELKALWEKVKVKEVVTKTDPDHRVSSDGQLTYQYASNTNDNRPEVKGREEFSLSELGITLTDEDWNVLIAGDPKIFAYSAYDHSSVGTIMIRLESVVKPGEKDLSESPHDTAVTGDEVEKYTLTVSYRPAGANISDWHTGSYGSGMSGSRAGNILKDNTHIINVFVKGLKITKVDLNDQVLRGAKFALYRSARTGETELLEIDGGQYYKVADLDTSSNGIAVKEQIEQLEEGEQYYLVETEVPAGYITIAPIPGNLNISDEYIPKPGTAMQTSKPETGIFDWTQKASLVFNAESGVKRTNADNTEDLTHSAIIANSDTEILYYRITNNPGAVLPSTGGPGTRLYTILGSILILGAGALLGRRRKLI